MTLDKIQSRVFKTVHGTFIDIKVAKSQIYYEELIESKLKEPTAISKWLTNHNIEERLIYSSYILHKNSCLDTTLRAFQYKIINNIVATNKTLHKWGLNMDNKCDYCDEVDTTWHMLCECHLTVNWKEQIFQKLQIRTPEHKEFLFGSMEQARNVIYLTIKRQIWSCRYHKTNWSLPNIIQELKAQIQADANYLNDIRFRTKWENYISILEL